MSWSIILTGIGAGSGLFNAIDEYRANRAIRQDLERIKQYLAGLAAAVDQLHQQNREILARLDRLPVEIRRIVQEVVDAALLRERYSAIGAQYEQYLAFDSLNGYGIHSDEWNRFWQALYYLFEHENRPSRTFDLLRACEIGLVITKERALPLIRSRLEARIAAMRALADALQSRIETDLMKLHAELQVNLYVTWHNLSPSLPSLDALVYTPAADRVLVYRWTDRICETRRRGRYEDPVEICREVPRERQEDDVAFRAARDAHIAGIRSRIEALRPRPVELGALRRCIALLEDYLRTMLESASVDTSLESLPMYHFAAADAQHARAEAPLMTEDEERDMRDYFDSVCDGDCEGQAELRTQPESLLFMRDPIC